MAPIPATQGSHGIFLYEARFINDVYGYFSSRRNAILWVRAVRRARKAEGLAIRKGDHKIQLIKISVPQVADLLNGMARGFWSPPGWAGVGPQSFPDEPIVIETFEAPIRGRP